MRQRSHSTTMRTSAARVASDWPPDPHAAGIRRCNHGKTLDVTRPLPGTADRVRAEREQQPRTSHDDGIDGPRAPRPHRRQRQFGLPAPPLLASLLIPLLLWVQTASAVFLSFDNCLSDSYIYTSHLKDGNAQLQWVPTNLSATFEQNTLLVNVWGNVTGKAGDGTLPAWNSSEWDDPNGALLGKIVNEPANITTLYSKVEVATYKPYSDNSAFCSSIMNGTCPLGPVFKDLPDLPYGLPYFNLSYDFSSSYAFTSFAPTFIIYYGDKASTTIGCISTTVTPSLGGIAWFLKFLPLIALLLVGFATIFAAIFSPWGTSDIFHWSSNYGRDLDLLRLVTPGFGDCLQYIQFIVLTGGLTLNYPGFYQPAVSNGAWSALMFNESFVSGSDPWQSLQDGVYFTNSTYGLGNIAQLVGMGSVEDVWAGMMIWLLVIIGLVAAIVQAYFVFRWIARLVNNTSEQDLRAKNIPFSIGVVIRIVFNYFLLPIVALSTFQLVIAAQSQTVLVAMAVVTIALMLVFAAYLMHLIVSTKPRAHLFDDLPTVLTYGPLYNTYSDQAAPFALVPILLTFVRGIAIGAIQGSGIAQIVILAVCEVIQILTILAFRPFNRSTNMNAYHAGFSIFRFVTVIPMVAFVPSMGLTEGSKAWTGYVILVLHGSVLVFGFFLNALQTIIEVIARMCGAGGDDVQGQTRGGLSKIFGARQLQRRVSRQGATSRQSQLSTAGMLDAYNNSRRGYGRVRSGSAGSMGIMLHTQQRSSSVLDSRSLDGLSGPFGGSTFVPTTPREASTFSFVQSPGQATRPQPAADPYYRPPRARRLTNEDMGASPPRGNRASMGSIDLADRRLSHGPGLLEAAEFETKGSGTGPTPAPQSYMPIFAPRADYSTREVDFYYGVRGPALNSDAPGRRLGTGPADPTSPVATATGWIRGLFGGKTKEKGKGFEVVRSARMPPAMRARGGEFSDEAPPEGIPVAMGVLRNGPIESDDEEDSKPKPKKRTTGDSAEGAGDAENGEIGENAEGSHQDSPESGRKSESDNEEGAEEQGGEEEEHVPKVSENPPLLPDLDAGESFKFPSRVQSTKTTRQASQRTTRTVGTIDEPPPEVPRKSSKRNSGADFLKNPSFNLVPPAEKSSENLHAPAATGSARLPFDRSSQRRLSGSSMGATTDELSSQLPSAGSNDERPTSFGHVHQHSISRVDPDSDQTVDLFGSAAEVVNGSRRVSPSSSVSARSRT